MHFAARKNVLEYDDVMNLQRKAIYEERNAILDGKDISARIPELIGDAAYDVVADDCAEEDAQDWDLKALDLWVANMTGRTDFSSREVAAKEDSPEAMTNAVSGYLQELYNQKEQQLGPEMTKNLAAQVMLRIIDTRWMAHLQEMDYLKTGIGLRAFGQRDPLVEYKNEAYEAFQGLTATMYDDFLRTLLRLEIAAKPQGTPGGAIPEHPDPLARKVSYSAPEQALEGSAASRAARPAPAGAAGAPPKPAPAKPQTYQKDADDPYANVGRNDPCPCGSGKKFKKCHGRDL